MGDFTSKEEATAQLREEAKDFRNVFSSPSGKNVLKVLKSEFDKDALAIARADSSEFELGCKYVTDFIDQLIQLGETE